MNGASAGAPEGTVFLAEEQTAGRGRGANRWTSARSTGIYCSAILRPVLPPADVLVLSLAVGLAVRAAVTEINPGLNPDLKWPNDLLLNDKKFCGILTEMNAEPTRVRHLVVGVGINVNQKDFPADLRDRATSLQLATGTEWSRVELAAALLKSLDREYRALHDGPSARNRRTSRSGHPQFVAVRWKCSTSRNRESSRFEGATDGLDDRGFLRVKSVHRFTHCL
jgi:BirA family biotin operon repressor/biotin-[acetyl-CoA-carboxylase] ligase